MDLHFRKKKVDQYRKPNLLERITPTYRNLLEIREWMSRKNVIMCRLKVAKMFVAFRWH